MKKQRKVALKPGELQTYLIAMQSRLSSEDAIRLAFSRSDQILKELEGGRALEDILDFSQTDSMEKLAGRLMGILSLEQALHFAMLLKKKTSAHVMELVKKSFYPLFLLAFSSALLFFFIEKVQPALSGFGSGSTSSNQPVLTLFLAFLCAFWILLAAAFLIFGLAYVQSGKNPALLYEIWKLPFFQYLHSIQLAAFLMACLKGAISSYQADQICKSLKELPFLHVLSRCSASFENRQDAGRKIHALLPESFWSCYHLGQRQDSLEEMMENWIMLADQKLVVMVKGFVQALSLFSYFSVGILVISLYQAMLAPMDMMMMF